MANGFIIPNSQKDRNIQLIQSLGQAVSGFEKARRGRRTDKLKEQAAELELQGLEESAARRKAGSGVLQELGGVEEQLFLEGERKRQTGGQFEGPLQDRPSQERLDFLVAKYGREAVGKPLTAIGVKEEREQAKLDRELKRELLKLQIPTEELEPEEKKVDIALKRERLRAEKLETSKKAKELAGIKPTQTIGQKKVDERFAKEYAEFFAGGGFADANKSIQQLEGVINEIEGGTQATGPGIGLIPKLARDLILPKGAAIQDAVEEIVQRNLRLVLGSQFTEKEGTRLIERAYNPRLDESENAIRLRRLKDQMQGALNAKIRAGEYFQQNGTLRGFNATGMVTSVDDFDLGGTVQRRKTIPTETRDPLGIGIEQPQQRDPLGLGL